MDEWSSGVMEIDSTGFYEFPTLLFQISYYICHP
jgi:hypothetical protein